MIERTPAFKVGDKGFLTLVEAQKYELVELATVDPTIAQPENTADWVLKNKEKIVDILTTTKTSKTKARKINGGTKMKKVDSASVKESLRISLPPNPVDGSRIKVPESEVM